MIHIDGLECERAIKRLDNNLPLYLDLIESTSLVSRELWGWMC